MLHLKKAEIIRSKYGSYHGIKLNSDVYMYLIMVTQIHVLAIDGVSHPFIHNPNNVLAKITEFCAEKDDYEVTHISTLDELDTIIRNPPEKLVLVNGHGETIPMPETWTNWELYVRQISNNIFNHGWIVVSITGMPFWYFSSDENNNVIQWNGINVLLENTGARISEQLVMGGCNLTKFGRNVSRIYGEPLTDLLLCGRLLRITNLSLVTKSLYRIGEMSGISAIRIGQGYLLHNGLMASNITPQTPDASQITDEHVTLLSMMLTVGLLDSNGDAREIFESSIDNENNLRKKVIIPLLRLKGFHNVSDVHGSDEHGRDVVCFLNDRFGNRINYAFQIKATKIHNYATRTTNHIISIIRQIDDAFTNSFNDPFVNAPQEVHVLYIITSKAITPPAKTTIVTGTYGHKSHVHFIDGGKLKEEWLSNYIF